MKRIVFPLLFLVAAVSCGRKLSPDHDWNNKRWILMEVKGVPVQLSGSSRDAHLEFNTIDKKYTGSGGCNRIAGSYTLSKKTSISFTEPISTRMSCPDLAFEDLFIATLKTVDNEVETDNMLLLKKGRDVVLKLQTR